MASEIFRADAVYTVPFLKPALAFASSTAAIIIKAYELFSDRYAFIRPSAFRALNSVALAEVGFTITLLDGRFEIAIRVEHLSITATNLRNAQEIRFAQDCVALAHRLIEQMLPEVSMQYVNLRIGYWLKIDGGKEEAVKQLNRVAKPQRPGLTKGFLRANSIEHWLRIMFQNTDAGWRISLTAEPSAVPEADLYIMRDYTFDAQLTMDTVEKRLSFIETSEQEIASWLGIGQFKEVS